ncbi:MAG TPA: NUDIX domain-containing protein [Planctomycetota bacterium]|nr:NUDIX domain-containing protein [Planctomycetota bacterium]
MKPAPRGAAQAELLAWYAAVGRDLPWRRTRDPYRVLVSEVMLQQTQVERVLPFYRRFLELFPDAAALAAADADTLHRAWKGLGYPSRADRLQAACRAVLARGGAWPDTPEGLAELPGIGPYTSGAVACFASGRAVAVVDTNVARVYARRDALPRPLPRERIWAHAGAEVDRTEPIAYTNALMDLGATVCTARAPRCGDCPWRDRCASANDALIHAATANPLKVAAAKIAYGDAVTDRAKPRLHIVLALVHHDGRYLVTRRKAAAHCGGKWELPGGKRAKGEPDRVALARELKEELGVELLAARPLVDFSHDYGDRYLTLHCYRCRLFAPESARPLAADDLRWVTPAEFVALDFPAANAPLIARLRRYHRLG